MLGDLQVPYSTGWLNSAQLACMLFLCNLMCSNQAGKYSLLMGPCADANRCNMCVVQHTFSLLSFSTSLSSFSMSSYSPVYVLPRMPQIPAIHIQLYRCINTPCMNIATHTRRVPNIQICFNIPQKISWKLGHVVVTSTC